MTHANGPLATNPFKIIGKVNVPVVSWNPDMTTIRIRGTESSVFYNHKPGDDLPKIIEGESAFCAEVVNKRAPIALYMLLVKKVIEYDVNPIPNSDERGINILIEFEKLVTDYRRDDVVVVEPVVTGIISRDRWLMLIVEGDEDARQKYLDLKYFRHGNSIYFVHKRANFIWNAYGAEPVVMAAVILASTNETESDADINGAIEMMSAGDRGGIQGRYSNYPRNMEVREP